jgi:hypothetical protein
MSERSRLTSTPPGSSDPASRSLKHLRAPQSILKQKKVDKVLKLLRKGYDYLEIGAQMGIEPSYASRMIAEALAQIPRETAEMALALELERLDAMHKLIYHSTRSSDLKAIDRLLRISKQRIRLLGLDRRKKPTARPHYNPIEEARKRAEFEARLDEAFRRALENRNPNEEAARATSGPQHEDVLVLQSSPRSSVTKH